MVIAVPKDLCLGRKIVATLTVSNVAWNMTRLQQKGFFMVTLHY